MLIIPVIIFCHGDDDSGDANTSQNDYSTNMADIEDKEVPPRTKRSSRRIV